MTKIKRLIYCIPLCIAFSATTLANSVTLTFVNHVSAFAAKTNPELLFADLPTIISPDTFNGGTAINMPYSGAATLITPGAHYFDAHGPVGPGYYNMTCIDAGGYPTTIDTRYGGSATITFANLAKQPTLELTCTCNGTACGTNQI